MIKFKIFANIWEGERWKFGEVLEKCQNFTYFDIFWGILDKRKGNLGQECAKRGILSLQGKTGTLALISLEK